jgi:hypothetical protein
MNLNLRTRRFCGVKCRLRLLPVIRPSPLLPLPHNFIHVSALHRLWGQSAMRRVTLNGPPDGAGSRISNSLGCGVCGAALRPFMPLAISSDFAPHVTSFARHRRRSSPPKPFPPAYEHGPSSRVGLRARISFAEGHPRDFRERRSAWRSARHRQFILLCRRHAHARSKVHTKATHVDGGCIEWPTDRPADRSTANQSWQTVPSCPVVIPSSYILRTCRLMTLFGTMTDDVKRRQCGGRPIRMQRPDHPCSPPRGVVGCGPSSCMNGLASGILTG